MFKLLILNKNDLNRRPFDEVNNTRKSLILQALTRESLWGTMECNEAIKTIHKNTERSPKR
jgi:hypothetical protein